MYSVRVRLFGPGLKFKIWLESDIDPRPIDTRVRGNNLCISWSFVVKEQVYTWIFLVSFLCHIRTITPWAITPPENYPPENTPPPPVC